MRFLPITASFLGIAALVAFVGCSGGGDNGSDGSSGMRGSITIDGSSTVFPLTAAVAEEFSRANPSVRVAVAYSGTGGGFKKFDAGETDINNASRPISASEIDMATRNGVGFIELPVAYDGLTVIINPRNDWVDHLTTEELRMMWEPGSEVTRWNHVRPEWPDERITLFGPGTDSGTFDYFTEAIMGESGASRPDFTATEDDNLTVQGVSGNVHALGYLGVAYYVENQQIVDAVAIKHGDGEAVLPDLENVMTNRYVPLSRPLFMYVRESSTANPAVDAFVDFYLANAAELAIDVGYVPLPDEAYALIRERYEGRVTGSVFQGGGATVGVRVQDILRMAGETP